MSAPKDLNEAVQAWREADRAYQTDCNMRWQIKTDPERRRLRAASRRAYKRMERLITEISARRRGPR